MSFGFLTESALLPSKSKPIQVDGRSLVDLKAIVYAKEQKVKLDGGAGGGSGSGGLRGLRGKRASAAADGAARKDPFARSNRGVEDRSQRDELEKVTASKKRKAAQRTLSAKSSLYEKMAKGEVDASSAGSLVDFARKSDADLALLRAKAGKPKRRETIGKPDSSGGDGRNGGGGGSGGKKRRLGGKHGGESPSDSNGDPNVDSPTVSADDFDDYDGGHGGGAEIVITDEFGRERTVVRGGREHRAHLAAEKAEKAAAEERAKQQADSEAYDERYSYRGNRGSAPPPPPPFGGAAAAGGGRGGGGSASSSGASAAAGQGGGWAWSSGVGRGADAGDFETREGQDRRAKKDMAGLLEREGGGAVGRDEGGAKILSQWEKTLTGDQKTFLREVQEESAASRGAASQTSRGKQRSERKELLRRKQEERAARSAVRR